MANFMNRLWGSKPTLPSWTPLNLQTEASRAIAGNEANLTSAEGLVGAANKFSADQMTRLLNMEMPGFTSTRSTIAGNIASEVSGKIPTDVSEAVQNSAAARSLGGGFGGSGMGRDLVARDLGLTSLDLTNQGLSSAESWMKTMDAMYQPTQMNISSMFVTPQQQATFDTQERDMQFQHDWLGAQIEAMPDPRVQGMWNMMSRLGGSLVGSLGSLSTDGSGSGGGGGGGGMGGMMGGGGGGMLMGLL